MKFIILALLLTFSAVMADDVVTDYALFVDGFLRGALEESIVKVDDCLKDGDSIIADVGKILKDIESGFDLPSLIDDIGTLFKDIPNSLKDCKDLPPTMKETFTKWGKELVNPKEMEKIITKALLHHRKELENDASGFQADWKNGQFESSGQKLGDIPHILFDLCVQNSLSVTPFDAGHFLDGFFTSILQSEIKDVESCLTDADKLIDDIQKFVTDIEGGFDLLKIIGDLGSLFTDIPSSITDCDDFKDDVETVLNTWEEEIKDPVTIAKIVYIALAQYSDRLKSDANTFVDEWKAEHYEHSGTLLGDIPHVLFDLCSSSALEYSFVESLLGKN